MNSTLGANFVAEVCEAGEWMSDGFEEKIRTDEGY